MCRKQNVSKIEEKYMTHQKNTSNLCICKKTEILGNKFCVYVDENLKKWKKKEVIFQYNNGYITFTL